MSNKSEGFVSDIFGKEPGKDVRQLLEYNLVKSYPSVNSSNGGGVHSEENVRWLTKQFIKKPFIIQYDDNNMAEFNYDGADLYAGKATGGMVNIDGYIINTADDMTKLSFDNTQDTYIGTGSTAYSGGGYINHIVLQKAIAAFMYGEGTPGLTNSDISGYINFATLYQWNWAEKKALVLDQFVNAPGNPFPFDKAGSTIIRYTKELVTYIKDNFDPLPSADGVYIQYVDATHIEDVDNPYIDVTYYVNYGYTRGRLKFNCPSDPSDPEDPTKLETYKYTTYNSETQEDEVIDTGLPNYQPILFVKDIFGLQYVFQSDIRVGTDSYPGQINTQTNLLFDNVTPGRGTEYENSVIYKTDNIYDMSSCYLSYTDKNAGIVKYDGNNPVYKTELIPGSSTDYGEYYAGIEDTTRKVAYNYFMDNWYKDIGKYVSIYHLVTGSTAPTDWGTATYYEKINDNFITIPSSTPWESGRYYSKEDTSSSFTDYFVKLPNIALADLSTAKKSVSTFFSNTYFDIETEDNIFARYEFYKGSFSRDDLESSALRNLSTEYYCLPLSKLGAHFQELFCISLGTTPVSYVPVGFVSSTGALIAENVGYEEDMGGATVQRVLVEGYASLLRRICKIVTGYGNQDYYNGKDISNTYESSEGWNLLLKDLQTGNVVPPTQSSLNTNTAAEIAAIFGVADVTDITFDIIYNKVLAPYMNFYIQLSWSAILDHALLNEGGPIEGRFKSRQAYSVMQHVLSGNGYNILSDDGQAMTVEFTRNIVYNGVTYENVPRQVYYAYNRYPDYGRLKNFLCEDSKQYIGQTTSTHPIDDADNRNIVYRNKITTIEDADNLEDYITYLRQCAQKSWNYNLDGYIDSNFITIPYKVTTLTADTYGFATFDEMVDNYERYTNKYESGNSDSNLDYINAASNNAYSFVVLTPEKGYLQNIAVRMDTFVPERILSSGFVYPPKYDGGDSNHNHAVAGTIGISGVQCTICPLQPPEFVLNLTSHQTIDYAGQVTGLSGFCAAGKGQGWTVCIPTLFRLYKDSQNYLDGRDRGTTEHAGVTIDYKLPNDITDEDFWFANTWLSSVRSVGTWDIETGVSDYPTATDGMLDYLGKRNHTLFNINTIYGVGDYGELISIDELISRYVNTSKQHIDTEIAEVKQTLETEIQDVSTALGRRIDDVNSTIGNTPVLPFVDFEIVQGDKTVAVEQHRGMAHNITRLKTYVDESQPEVSTTLLNNRTLYISNNTFYNIERPTSGTLVIETAPDSAIWDISQIFAKQPRYLMNTLDNISTNNVIKTTVRIHGSNSNTVNIYLGQIINEFQTGGVTINWGSNYPLGTITNNNTTYTTIKITDRLNTTLDCLIEITIIPDAIIPNENRTASGYCNILLYSNPTNTLTLNDMNYLWKELYPLESLTWNQVSNVVKSGLAPKIWNLGDIKTFKVIEGEQVYNIPAMIIGFNQEDSDNSITWLTNIYNANIPGISTSEIFNKTFNHSKNIGTANGTGIYGYDYYKTSDNEFVLPVTKWLNNEVKSATDTEFLNVVAPVSKTTGMVYTCSNGTEYALVKSVSTGTVGNNKRHSTVFWLPSISELGLSFSDDDPGEHYINEHSLTNHTRDNTPFTIDGYTVREVLDNSLSYDYFKLAEQNVKSLTLLTSSYYDINKELAAGADVNSYANTYKNGNVETSDSTFRNEFDSVTRYQYVVGTGYTANNSSNRSLMVLHKEDVASILDGEVHTDFCFVVK